MFLVRAYSASPLMYTRSYVYRCPHGTPHPSLGRQSNVAGTHWPPPVLGTPKAGVGHLVMTMAAHTVTTDGTTQPQLTLGR